MGWTASRVELSVMSRGEQLSFVQWEAATERRRDASIAGPLWRMTAYRMAVYAIEVGWDDVRVLDRWPVLRPVASQLYRALGSTAANIAGYSRGSGRDRVRLFEYALGSARESQVWYRAATPVLGDGAVQNRLDTLVRISKLLSAVIPAERRRQVRKGSPSHW